MNVRIPFDPYSPTRSEDYEKIKSDLKEFDVLGLLYDELRKSRVHLQFCMRVMKAFKYLDDEILSEAFIIMIEDIDKKLYPIFPNIMITASRNFDRLNNEAKKALIGKLKELVEKDSYVVQMELNAAYLLKIVGRGGNSLENQKIVNKIYKKFHESTLVINLCIQVMARWKVHPWVADLKSDFQRMSQWEKRMFIIASYILGGEGEQFRASHEKSFSKFECLVRDWVSERFKKNTDWEIPL